MQGAGYARTDETSQQEHSLKTKREAFINAFGLETERDMERASSERAVRRELEQMTAREVEKFREWCERNAVPVVLV